MCGIAGFNWSDRILLQKMMDAVSYREPDESGYYAEQEKIRSIQFLNIDEKKIVVIPNGVNTTTFHPRSTILVSDHPTLLWVGRFVPGKGVNFLLAALSDLVKIIPNLRVQLIGEGYHKKDIEEMILAYSLTNNVEIRQFVSYQEMPAIYQNYDVFVLPSLQESVPRTILEAMACGNRKKN
jgi:glycosyltransferase involved in cell wall biosynthesis